MAMFDNGVKSYIVGTARIEVSFPVDYRGNADVRCEQCEYFSRTSKRCKLNGLVVEYPEKYIGSHCPLNFEED